MAKLNKSNKLSRAERPEWYTDAAELMVVEKIDLRQAVARLGVVEAQGLGSEEIAALGKSKEFQELLQKAKNRYFESLAQDRSRSKRSLIGQMLYCIEMLLGEGAWDKALEGGLKLAKVEGWLTETTGQQLVLGTLTHDELQKAKDQLKKELSEQVRSESERASQIWAN